MHKIKRGTLTKIERAVVHWKTDGHCHICGGKLGKNWAADHVIHRERGGYHSLDNYLPACKTCNGLRWSYSPEDIQWILRLGIRARRQIIKKTPLGKELEKLDKKIIKQNRKRVADRSK